MKEDIVKKFEEFCEDLYIFKDDDMGGHFEGVVGDQIANTKLGYLIFKEKLEDFLSDYKRVLKENEELKEKSKEENELNKIIKDTKLDELFYRRNGKKVGQAIKLRDELLKLPECKLYGIKKCKKNVILITKEEVIPVQKVKDKIEEYKNMLKTCNKAKDVDRIKAINERILELQELLEGRK